MRRLILGSLSVVLGIAAVDGFAQDTPSRPAIPAFQRVASANGSAISLSRPVPLDAAPQWSDDAATMLERPAPTFRAKTLDAEEIPQLMPIGPSALSVSQPGTVKSMGTPDALRMPRAQDNVVPPPAPSMNFTGPPPTEHGCSSDSVSYVGNRVMPYRGGAVMTDGDGCGACSTGCDNSCIEGRLSDWFHSWRDGCSVCCDDPCCLVRPRGWIRGEYLLWKLSSQNLPPLLTTSSNLADPFPGAIDQANTQVLFGGGDEPSGWRSGGRIALGFWFPRHCNWGLDASFFMLGNQTTDYVARSDGAGNPPMFRPFRDDMGEKAQIVSLPQTRGLGLDELATEGGFSYVSTTRFWGADANLRHRLSCGPRYWIDGFVGYRHLNLADTLTIREDPQLINAPRERFIVQDQFGTRNQFNGLQIGFEGEVRLLRRWFLAGSLKLAAGNVHQIVNIAGTTEYIADNAGGSTGISGRSIGGLYALRSNIGKHERDRWAVAPELGIKLGFDLNEHWRLYAGYNLLFISEVVRAGEQIDRNINVNMVPRFTNPFSSTPPNLGPPPAVLFRQSEFWAQGGNFGVEYHW